LDPTAAVRFPSEWDMTGEHLLLSKWRVHHRLPGDERPIQVTGDGSGFQRRRQVVMVRCLETKG
jgi:hypothetical protein